MPDRIPRAAGQAKPRRSRLLWVGLPVFTVFATFGIIVWLAYQENARVPVGEPPLIRAIAAPYKIAPDDPGGREIAEQGEINQLLRDEPVPALPERVLPLPEEPRTPTVVARPEPAEPAVTEDQPTSATPEQAAPAQSASAPEDAGAQQQAEAALARLLADIGPQTSPEPSPEPDPSSSEPPAATREPAAAPDPVPEMRPAVPPTTTAPTIVTRDTPEIARPVDAPSQEADEALNRLLAEVAGVPVEDTPAPQTAPANPPTAVAAIAPADPSRSQPPIGPGYRVQLAAVRDQDEARRAWADLAERLGSVVTDHQPYYERAETANGVFYRIQLGPFASEQTADRMCAEVQRRNASCFVVAR